MVKQERVLKGFEVKHLEREWNEEPIIRRATISTVPAQLYISVFCNNLYTLLYLFIYHNKNEDRYRNNGKDKKYRGGWNREQ